MRPFAMQVLGKSMENRHCAPTRGNKAGFGIDGMPLEFTHIPSITHVTSTPTEGFSNGCTRLHTHNAQRTGG